MLCAMAALPSCTALDGKRARVAIRYFEALRADRVDDACAAACDRLRGAETVEQFRARWSAVTSKNNRITAIRPLKGADLGYFRLRFEREGSGHFRIPIMKEHGVWRVCPKPGEPLGEFIREV